MSSTARAFQRDFFDADGRHPDKEGAFRHFRNSFVEPQQFGELIDILKPPSGDASIRKRVVLIDGHPRSGKTWAVLAAIGRMAEESNLDEEQLWNSGLDSLKLFQSASEPLTSGIRKLQAAWKKAKTARVFFVDDFLGTNVPREMLRTDNKKLIRNSFTWGAGNPLLEALPCGSVLVITGRSLHFTLLDILFDVRSRETAGTSNDIEVVNWRRGLFRTHISRDIFGSFTESALHQMFDRTLKFHPGKANSWILLAAVPMLAFLNKSLASPANPLQEKERSIAARVLFGEDIEAIAQHIKRVWHSLPQGEGKFEGIEVNLLVAYMLYLAPAFLFLGPEAYGALGIECDEAKKLTEDLYLSGSIEDRNSARLPNEFYMVAVRDHLEDWLPLAAKVFARLCKYRISDQRFTGIGIRALIERCLTHRKLDVPAPNELQLDLRSLASEYIEKNHSFLLSVEVAPFGIASNQMTPASDELNSGLGANVGWVLYKFFNSPDVEHIRNGAVESFKKCFAGFLARKCPNGLTRTQTIQWDEAYWNTISGWYSTFLQWAIRMDRSSGILQTITEMTAQADRHIQLRLKMILEDEILWALLEQNYDVSHLDESAVLQQELCQPVEASSLADEDHRFLGLNRFFSLAWHNEWMQGLKTETHKRTDRMAQCRIELLGSASRFLKSSREVALQQLRKTPDVLDSNFGYHWCHFVTQHALWMRDWTFAPDPNEFERNRIACGSDKASDNTLLMDIVERVIVFPCPGNRHEEEES
jgi:hypothetical protein